MTDSHHVIISSYPMAGEAASLVEIECSCGELLLKGQAEISVDEASNLRWQHLIKYIPPFSPETMPSTAITFDIRDWNKWRTGE